VSRFAHPAIIKQSIFEQTDFIDPRQRGIIIESNLLSAERLMQSWLGLALRLPMKQGAPTYDEGTAKWEAKRQPMVEIGAAERSMAQQTTRETARGAKATDQGGQAGTAQAGAPFSALGQGG
jgi:hypothetical protein